ncbi:MAG: HEAT repeat domain-containing protein [Planctomycetota bacterium]
MRPRRTLLLIGFLAAGVQVSAGGAASTEPAEQLLKRSRDAYAFFDRAKLGRALAAKGVAVRPELGKALDADHWHVRHCALLAVKELAREAGNRKALESLVPALGLLVTGDPHHGVRIAAAECLEAMGEHGKGAQVHLAKAAVNDDEDWVKASASKALTKVGADIEVMMPVFEAMIRSTDKMARGEGIAKADDLRRQGVDVAPLVPALKDVFRKPIYDAIHSSATRSRAINLLNTLKVDTRELVPFIVKDLRNVFKKLDDGYHPYQKITLDILGRMGAAAEEAVPVLEEVIADPPKFGCDKRHPDYKRFISISEESIKRIRADMARKGKRR